MHLFSLQFISNMKTSKIISGLFRFCLTALVSFTALAGHSNPPAREYYEIRVYHLNNSEQESRMDKYLKDALVPGLHRAGIKQVGVFKPIGNDTSANKRVILFIPYRSLNDLETVNKKLQKDQAYLTEASDYLDAAYDKAPYKRIEKTLLKAFPKAPVMQLPGLTSPKSERVYELRSYESSTDKLYENKVKMFNDGNEVGIFKDLGFNAVFYGDVIAGSSMPNLMYMTTFDNKASREEHWKAFSAHPEWKKLVAMPEYSHNVSKADIYFLYPAEYSDF
jgi:hypothetical protein